jgi:hypothetical protein
MDKLDIIKLWLKDNKRKIVFFIIFFLGFGTSSIWMSALFLDIDIKDIIVGILTISIATVYTSAERILTLIRKRKNEDNEDLIELIAVSIPLILSCLVIGLMEKCIILSAIISFISYVLCCRLWWYQNRDNKTLAGNGNMNPLAGSAEQFKKK